MSTESWTEGGLNSLTDIYALLFELCGDKRVFDPNCELIESGLLDSYAMIELFSRLEDDGIELNPARIDKGLLSTPSGIQKLAEDYLRTSERKD